VIVVGAGIAGVACARALHGAGHAVRVVDRGRGVGGRMAVRTEDVTGTPRVVDVGASYFTVRDERFVAVVERWRAAGLAREWTDTFAVVTAEGSDRSVDGSGTTTGPVRRTATGPVRGTATGPVRWAAAGGLRSLVEDLAAGLDVRPQTEVEEVDVEEGGLSVDGEPAAAVVLAMPDPQAADLLPEPVSLALGLDAAMEWASSIAVWAAWESRWWGDLDGAFVDGSPIVSWIADDGRRRGDGAPVLVAHSTPDFAAGHLEHPDAAIAPVLAEVVRLFAPESAGMISAEPAAMLSAEPAITLSAEPAGAPPAAGGPPGGVRPPMFARAHRWSLAAPLQPHAVPFGLHPALVGVCGDGWGEHPRIEQAWLSGHLLGQALAARLT
jgi:predicted NAD/FAD-dependent oxidoreductase